MASVEAEHAVERLLLHVADRPVGEHDPFEANDPLHLARMASAVVGAY
jgi:hypothetical protein